MSFRLFRPLQLIGLGMACSMACMVPPSFGNGGGEPRADLPYAPGRRFADLDAYLAHLRELGTMGIPWFRLLPDGRYVEVRRRPPGGTPEVFTRRELLDRFGFDE